MLSRLAGYVLPAPARWCAYVWTTAGGIGLGVMLGERVAGQRHIDYITAQAAQTVAIGRAQTKVVLQTEIKYRDRIKTIYVKGDEIEKQVPVYVTAADDQRCVVNTGFVRAYNAAWSGDLAGAAADADREPAGISLAEVAEADAFNATTCRAWREQVIGWREFYKGLKAATDIAVNE
ncbi:MAG: hypothetical protein K2X55_27435 [Burkholderiaceae bacterium]|nr:hypothetical protein [Burkholderiaceae bacterium]